MAILSLTLLQLVALLALMTPVASSQEELASEAELYTGKQFQKAFANPEDTTLPNVLIIGDSISIGYTVPLRIALHGEADVFRIPTNGRYAAHGLKKLEGWLGDRHWDVIHFNWGLWDLCYRNPDSNTQGGRDKVNGTLTATPEQYGQTMNRIMEKLASTQAKLIWCATTPVPEGEPGRKVGDDNIYNTIAGQLAEQHGIAINDLHSHALQRLPAIQLKPGDVHFTEEGSAYLAAAVAAAIRSQLPTD